MGHYGIQPRGAGLLQEKAQGSPSSQRPPPRTTASQSPAPPGLSFLIYKTGQRTDCDHKFSGTFGNLNKNAY